MGQKIQKLIQTRKIYRKIIQKIPNTPERALITATENTARSNNTWPELAEILRKIQKMNSLPMERHKNMPAHEIYTGEEEMKTDRWTENTSRRTN